MVPHGRMPVDALTKDDASKCYAALSELMSSPRLTLVDEGGELERRKSQPELKNRSQAASRKELDQEVFLTWAEFRHRLVPGGPGGGGGGVG
eukprot:2661240-Pyramimonas_sp.AAC.2